MAEDPYMGSIPAKQTPMPKTATRVSAHKEGANNDLKNRQKTESPPAFGPLGQKGTIGK
jgi:hypothetical protein